MLGAPHSLLPSDWLDGCKRCSSDGETGVTCGVWPFSAVTLHFLMPEFSSGEGACQPLTHGRIRDLTFFHGTAGLRMDALFDFGW